MALVVLLLDLAGSRVLARSAFLVARFSVLLDLAAVGIAAAVVAMG
jgi:hypothetical protein